MTAPQSEIDRLRGKVATYERLLHDINMYAAITLDSQTMKEIISLICEWSYAHRVGNGQLSDEEQAEMVQKAYNRLKSGQYRPKIAFTAQND